MVIFREKLVEFLFFLKDVPVVSWGGGKITKYQNLGQGPPGSKTHLKAFSDQFLRWADVKAHRYYVFVIFG